MSLGSRIRELRKNKNMTQGELGNVLGVSKVSVSGYENDTRQPDNKALVKMASYFGVTTDYLLGHAAETATHPASTSDVIAAHIDDDTPEDERQQIINFIENLKRARGDM